MPHQAGLWYDLAMKKILFLAFLAVLLSLVLPAASKTFDMYVIDTEGGKSLLLISPSGESMLIDSGFPGSDDRDAKRIAEAVKAAGLKQIDHTGHLPLRWGPCGQYYGRRRQSAHEDLLRPRRRRRQRSGDH